MKQLATIILVGVWTSGCITTPEVPPREPLNVEKLSGTYAPSPRALHTSVWTEHGMIVWGGLFDPKHKSRPTGGAILTSETGYWKPIAKPEIDASSRYHHSSVWTGKELVIWGGRDGNLDVVSDIGLAYNATNNTWRQLTFEGAPEGREGQSTVWTKKEMIIFGGESEAGIHKDAYAYEPKKDSWRQITPPEDKVAGRSYHSAIWTGKEMIVFGGMNNRGAIQNGFVYDPETGATTMITPPKRFKKRINHSAIWTGKEMIVFGGSNGDGRHYRDGAAYNPKTAKWRLISRKRAPSARALHTAIWTGNHMVVSGGTKGTGSKNTIGIYDPVQNKWQVIKKKVAARNAHTAVWSGSEILIWGGRITNDKFVSGKPKGLSIKLDAPSDQALGKDLSH